MGDLDQLRRQDEPFEDPNDPDAEKEARSSMEIDGGEGDDAKARRREARRRS